MISMIVELMNHGIQYKNFFYNHIIIHSSSFFFSFVHVKAGSLFKFFFHLHSKGHFLLQLYSKSGTLLSIPIVAKIKDLFWKMTLIYIYYLFFSPLFSYPIVKNSMKNVTQAAGSASWFYKTFSILCKSGLLLFLFYDFHGTLFHG